MNAAAVKLIYNLESDCYYDINFKKLILEVMTEVDASNVAEETRLVEDLHFDSLSIMMLAMKIEDEYDMCFDEPMTFRTVGEVIKFLETLKK